MLLELRLDLLKLDPGELRKVIPVLGLPVLLTARHPAEGGQGTEDAAGRRALLEPLLDLAALIDIELRSVMEMRDLLPKGAQPGGRGDWIVPRFPGHAGRRGPAGRHQHGAARPDCDAVKLATYLNGPDDLIRLMRIVSGTPTGCACPIMGMGPWGRVSRLVLAKLGSLLNYGFIGESNAPGQWPAARLKELLAEL